jgi:ribosomal protein L32
MVVRMRHTRAHTRNRRAHHALKSPAITLEGGLPALRHRASKAGVYKGNAVSRVSAKVERKLQKKQTKKKK